MSPGKTIRTLTIQVFDDSSSSGSERAGSGAKARRTRPVTIRGDSSGNLTIFQKGSPIGVCLRFNHQSSGSAVVSLITVTVTDELIDCTFGSFDRWSR